MAAIGNVIEGLQILGKYVGLDKHDLAAEHDILLGPTVAVSEEDALRLEELGWFVSGEFDDCWAHFV